MIQALIFDFDGLILETEWPCFQAWQEIYRTYNCDLPFEKWVVCVGGTDQDFDPHAYLESLLGQTLSREELKERFLRRLATLVAELPILPGVEHYVNEARRLGLKVGLASNSPHEWVHGHLQRLGLYDQFDVMKCKDEVSNPKPDPELYLAVLDELGISGARAVVFEDSPHGVQAARRAGIFCVAVPSATTKHLPLDHASMRLTSLADIPLEALLAHVEKQQEEATGFLA